MSLDFFSNISQLLLYWVFIIFAYRIRYIPLSLTIYFIIVGTSPFWFNYALFPPTYMPDQFRYLDVVQSLRTFEPILEDSPTVLYSSYILGMVPIPFIFNVIGIAFINKFLITSILIWLYYKKKIKGSPLIFILLYPDLLLYSSLALRDCLILIFMLIGAISLIQDKPIWAFLSFVPLWFIKFQNFLLMMTLLLLYILFLKRSSHNNTSRLFYFTIFLAIIFGGLAQFFPYLIDPINQYRLAMHLEDGNSIENFHQIENISALLTLAISNSIYFLLKPLFYEATNSFQLIQSVLNLITFLFLIIFTIQNFQKDKFKTLFWFSFLLFCMMLYGIVVINYGTAARYRFPFIVLYIIVLYLDIHKQEFSLSPKKECNENRNKTQ